MVTEAEKTYNLLSVNWRTREAGGVIQSESEGLRIRGVGGVVPSADIPAQEKGKAPLLPLFVYIYMYIYTFFFFLVALGLHCRTQAFSS